MRTRTIAVCVAALLAVGLPLAHAQEEPTSGPATREGDTLGWHVVQPGENLALITQRYLGTSRLWRENWRLNPEIPDPDLLQPGQRVRVILSRVLPARSAEVMSIERRVDKKSQPAPWTAARQGDRLKERDGLRTYRQSSAELSFGDGSRLTITEESLVFLREISQSLTGVQRESVEIVEGQADIEARPVRADSSEIEIIIGDTKATPRPGRAGVAQTRARRAAQGASEVMVYGGASEVEAAGASVTVPRGMGTRVSPGAPPSPPERLLPAPVLRSPRSGASSLIANPVLSWSPVEEAAGYTVEIFRDRAAAQLVEKAMDLAATEWQPEELPAGRLFWRVTAKARSGLDGFPSRSRALSVTGGPDRDPPVVVVAVVGQGRVTDAGEVLLGPGGALRVESHDDGSGVVRVSYRWDGGPWKTWTRGTLRPPEEGRHSLEFEAVDRLGRASPTWKVDVTRDTTPPGAPAVEAGHPR